MNKIFRVDEIKLKSWKKGKIWDIWQMNKELSSLNHNEPVSIYRRGEGGRGSRGIKGKQRGNQSSRTEFNGGLWKIDFRILQNLMGGIR